MNVPTVGPTSGDASNISQLSETSICLSATRRPTAQKSPDLWTEDKYVATLSHLYHSIVCIDCTNQAACPLYSWSFQSPHQLLLSTSIPSPMLHACVYTSVLNTLKSNLRGPKNSQV